MATIELKPKVQFGVVPTHVKFVGGLVPDENGKLPREEDGRLLVNAELERVNEQSKVRPNCSQTALFPGADEDDLSEMLAGFKDLGLTPHVIMMVAGGNPMDPADEDKIAPGLLAGLEAAKKHGIEHVSSTSLEEWMQPDKQELTGKDFDDAVAQLVKLHTRVCREANVLNSCIKAWHFEFLGIEFKTFTDIRKAWTVTKAANEAIGQPFFKVLVDAAHWRLRFEHGRECRCNRRDGQEDGFSMFHASAKTTRGCLSTDDGWVGNLLTACAATGKLEIVLVELFHHEDPALAGLREADPRHGIDTTDGRSYTEAVCDGLESVARRLNNLVNRGILKQ